MGIDTFTFGTVRDKIIFGFDASKKIAEEVKRLGAKRPLVITDNGIVKAGLHEPIKESLEDAEIPSIIFDKVAVEPTLESVKEAVDFTRENDIDIIVGLGGGSSMDTAKIVSALKTNPGEVEQYIGTGLFTKPRLPIISVPTTAGTGSEVSYVAVLTVGEKKRVVPNIMSDVALVDPRLTFTMPPKTTASTGLDALSHALESLMTTLSNPITETIALKAVELIGGNLMRAYRSGGDEEARYNMALASTLAGIALANAGVTLAHSAGYTVAHEYNLPHGVACATPLPYVMRFNQPRCEDLFASVAEAMGLEIRGLSKGEAASEAAKAVKSLITDLNVPTSLKELGVPRNQLKELAEEFVREYPRPNNVLPVKSEDALRLYEKMWEESLD
ncbi:MAG: iron-containing alcohol dehydrogenase [Nitrososphaeria archaeon]|nr:iron-containing alcohol dehydrogenase [Nitrososphaeria archaeon]NIQ32041.1 iron-containing alcohol dehydrogenase [Nitrososphaeria archaeon]